MTPERRETLQGLLRFVQEAIATDRPFAKVDLSIRFEDPVQQQPWLDYFGAKAPEPRPHPNLPVDMYYTRVEPWFGMEVCLGASAPNGWQWPTGRELDPTVDGLLAEVAETERALTTTAVDE